mgnify:CR=1 FL=1
MSRFGSRLSSSSFQMGTLVGLKWHLMNFAFADPSMKECARVNAGETASAGRHIQSGDKYDFYGTGTAGDRECDLALMAIEHKIETGGTNGEIPQFHPFQKRRKDRTHKPHEASSSIDL